MDPIKWKSSDTADTAEEDTLTMNSEIGSFAVRGLNKEYEHECGWC